MTGWGNPGFRISTSTIRPIWQAGPRVLGFEGASSAKVAPAWSVETTLDSPPSEGACGYRPNLTARAFECDSVILRVRLYRKASGEAKLISARIEHQPSGLR